MFSNNGAVGASAKKNRPSTGYLVRPRLGALRSLYSTRPLSAYASDKRKKLKKSTIPKMEYRRKPDYADNAYREAVSRLRILLAESYTPIKRPLRELDSAGEETDNQSLVSVGSRTSRMLRPYYHYTPLTPRRYQYYPPTLRTTLNIPTEVEKPVSDPPKLENPTAPPELMSFIERQEDYIEQLEKESQFCRSELSSLLSKVKEVISENENLHEKQKSKLIKSVFDHLETETETETESEVNKSTLKSPRKSKKTRIIEGPSIVFESRISELEAQLTQSKIDLKKAQEENENYKKKIADGSILDGVGFETYKKQLDNLQREKEVLQDTVHKLQNAIGKLREKENDTCDQVKRSLDVAEQAQYEKNSAELEIRRLKDELDRQHSKLRDAIADQGRRIADERTAVERRYTQQIEQLTAELGVQWEQTNKLQLELDKQRRENGDLRREVAQKQALIDDMKKDMQNKILNLQSDIGVSGAEKSALEQQIATLNLANERNERQAKQEAVRLQAEIQSLRQRLDRADADLIHSRRENIRLSEQVASLEKEINMNAALTEERNKTPRGGGSEIIALPPPKEDREKELSSLIQDMENKHGTDPAAINPKNESDSPSVRPTKRKEPIKVDISVKLVPKSRKMMETQNMHPHLHNSSPTVQVNRK
ncbi:serologically defined colon cancer antigen 8 homolog isoform X6 [Aethina tumida]|uniref:serologically defined colon cancer antigen 8 homolog isoform X6 n=1 Tax=Aethina tumida TaxID=116153 RepID=UPI0021477403|nr:serologically defined colon cancer antigen 8 homolog isoform X6 [Aethina tumida]